MSAEVDLTKFNAALRSYTEATGKGVPEVIKMQARLAVRDLIKQTGPDNSGKTARAIERDIRRVFISPKALRDQIEALIQERTKSFISQDYEAFSKVKWRNLKVGKRIEQLWQKNDARGMEALWRNIHGRGDAMHRLPVTNVIDPKRLDAARSKKTGSVPTMARGQAVIYAGKPANLARFIRERQADIGIAKAGWVAAATALEAPIPAAARKQSKRFGSVQTDLAAAATAPFVLIINSAAPAVAQDAAFKIVQKALDGRAYSINLSVQNMLERAAKKMK